MLDVKVKLRVDLKPLQRYVSVLTSSGQRGFNEVMIRWVVRYKRFAMARYRRNSKGGGDWPPLSKKTKKRVKKRSRQILIDSDTLRKTLEPIPTLNRSPSPGIQTIKRLNSITIQFGGGGSHPTSDLSIARLGVVHNQGLGNVPRRIILIAPTDAVINGMKKDVKDVAIATKKRLGMK